MKKLLCVLTALALTVALTVALAACGGESILAADNVLFSFGDGAYEVNRDYFYYQMLYGKEYYDGGNDAYWAQNPDAGDDVIASAVSYYQQRYAMLCWADSLGLGFTDADEAEVDAKINKYIESYGSREAFEKALADSCLTETVLRRLNGEDVAIQRLGDYLYGAESETGSVSADDLAAFRAAPTKYKAKHILVNNDEGEDKAQNLELARKLLAQLNAGADFDALMLGNTEDPGVQSYPGGYVFGDGEMVAEFESAVKALGMGEMSGIVESSYGYHIILRLELSDEEASDAIIDARISAELERRNAEALKSIKYADGFLELKITDFAWPYGEDE